jgi:hypothetical protein
MFLGPTFSTSHIGLSLSWKSCWRRLLHILKFFFGFPIPSFVVCFWYHWYHSSYFHYHIRRRLVFELKKWVMFMSNFDMYNIVIRKVRWLGGENGQFWHNRTSITGTQSTFSTNFGGKLSFILSLLFPERSSIAATYIFAAPTCTTTIITLEPCALNAEFQHFTPRFNKISLLCRYHWKMV